MRLDSGQRAWVEIGQQRSLEKVSHAIRDATSTNENMKKRKEKVHSTIAEVAAHVSSRFPSVHLEHKLDDDDERLAFKSFEGNESMTMPSLPTAVPMASAAPATSRGPGGPSFNSSAAAALHHGPRAEEEHRMQRPQRQQTQEDDFVCYINEVLGPVSSDDLTTDPLKKLETHPPPERER